MNNPFARSLSLRLLAIFAATAFLLVATLVALFTYGLSSQWQRSIRPHLAQYVHYVQEDLGSPPDPERARQLADALPVTIAIYRDGRFVYATDERQPDLEELRFRRLPSQLHGRSAGDRRFSPRPEVARERRDAVEANAADMALTEEPAVSAAVAREDRHEGTVLRLEQGRDTVYYRLEPSSGRRARADGLPWALLTVALILLGSYLLIRRQLAPIREVQHGVQRMSKGDLDHRIGLDGSDDLADLGRSIDEMAARIRDMLDAKRQLLLAISHELRSPLARARVATELLPESRQRERLEADLADMARLIEDLTESERLRTPHAALHREPLDLLRLVREETAPHGLAPTSIDGDSSLPIVADAARLRLMIRNLVGNALRHGRSADGTATVSVTLSRIALADDELRSNGIRLRETDAKPTSTRAVRLVVVDRGPGIAPEHLDAVTEPFHRPDASRTRASGGIGLGLSLARLVAEAHGGTLRVESDPATVPGVRVVVVLPCDGGEATT